MATKSGGLDVGVGFTQIATAAVGEEAVVFGLVFSNTTAADRIVTLRLYVQAEGAAVDIPFTLAADGRSSWEKAIGLQPGDTLAVAADAVGVTLLFSVDLDDGTNPVPKGLKPRGDFSLVATYAANDFVSYDGASWVSLDDNNTGNAPDVSPAFWMNFAGVTQAELQAAVSTAVDALIAGAPGALDTLNELATALGDDPNFATTMMASLAEKAPNARTITGAGLLAGQGGDLTANRVFTLTKATTAEYLAATSGAVIVTPEQIGAGETFSYSNITGSFTPDFNSARNFVWRLTGNVTLNVPTNLRDGQTGVIYFGQDETGGRTLATNVLIKKPNGEAVLLSTVANRVDRCGYVVRSVLGVPQLELTAIETNIS